MTLRGHLHEDELVSLLYRDLAGDDEAAVRRHLEGCPVCQARHEELRRVLALVDAHEVPEPGDDFEDRVWQRLEPRLPDRRSLPDRRIAARSSWWSGGWSVPRWALAGGLAAALVVAFVAGRITERPAAPTTRSGVAGTQAAEAGLRERVLLTALGDHFDRSQRVMVELSSVEAGPRIDLSAEQRRASDLLAATRIYHRAAQEAGDRNVADVLEALEQMLAEITMSPATPSDFELRALQARIGKQELLFKLRVASRAVRGRDDPPGRTVIGSNPGV